MAGKDQLRQITIKVSTTGDAAIRKIASQMGGLSRTVKGMSGDLSLLSNAFSGMLAAFGVREIVGMSDSIQQLGDRISVFAGGSENARVILGELGERARRTSTSIDDMATTYSRLAVASKEAGLSTEALLDLTETLRGTFKLSGASIEETAGASIQFSQALARGQLRGQELISVLSQNAYYADLLATSLNTTRGGLLKMAEAGEITANKALLPLVENMAKINSEAQKITPTIGQSMTLALNDMKLALYDLNKEWGISGTFAEGIKFVTKNLPTVIGLIGVLALVKVPALASSLKSLATGMLAFSVSHPIIAGLTAMAAGFVLLYDGVDRVQRAFEEVSEPQKLLQLMSHYTDKIKESRDLFGESAAKASIYSLRLKELQMRYSAITAISKTTTVSIADLRREDDKKQSQDRISLVNQQELIEKLSKTEAGIFDLTKAIAALNGLYREGRISQGEYFDQLASLKERGINEDFRKGKTILSEYVSASKELAKSGLNRSLESGAISMQKFNQEMEQITLEELNIKLQAGTSSLEEYDAAVIKLADKFRPDSALRAGAREFVGDAMTMSSAMARLVTTTFNQMEDHLVQFTKNGKWNFTQFVQSVLDDLNRVIIKMAIIQPLAQGLTMAAGSFFSGGGEGGGGATTAGGTSIGNRLERFASGGVVNSPTYFNHSRGKGLMGESGPEAIIPLSRTKNGDLGVKASASPVYVNVTNNAGVEVMTESKTGANGERIIELLIQSKVRESIANGSMDRVMQTSYGLNRRGG